MAGLAADDFESLRADMAKGVGPVRLAGQIQQTRMVFKYAWDSGLLDKPARFGQAFRRPRADVMRRHRNGSGKTRMFEPVELRRLLDAADPQLKAMILLGVNCGFGNADCGRLPLKALDLERGWIDFARPKTGIARRCPLWPETVAALRAWLAQRPKAKDPADADLVFLTLKRRAAWAKPSSANPVSAEFRKLLDRVGLRRPGASFYVLRHVFQTVGDGARDPVAVSAIMGHADNTMAGVYRERVDDDRLRAVVGHVRTWLFGKEQCNES